MKIKTFILTFLMMMSSPFLFGQQTGANYDWGDAPYSQHKAMMSAKLNLDGVTDYSIYEIGAFCGDEIRGKQRANSTGDFFLSIMLQESSEEISFRLYNHEADLEIFNVYETTTLSDNAHIGGPGNSVDVSATYVAKIGNAAYPTIEKAIAAAQEGETVTILAGNYEQTLNINKAITVQGERNQDENLVNIKGKLNITADGATAKNLNVNNGGSSAGCINAKYVTVDGCTVVGGNGFRYCYTTGLVTFKNSTITGSTYGIHFDGSADGEIVIDNCDITGWTSFAKAITKVTMKNGTTFNKGNYNYIRFYQQNVDIDGCTFNEDMAIDIAIDGNTTTIDGCTFTNGNIEDLFEDKDIVNSTIIVDGITLKREASIGDTYYKTLAEAFAAAQDGDEVKILVAGTYALSTSGKDITITGAVEGVVFDNIGAKNMGGANVTFNHVTFDYYPNVNYTGLQHSGNLVYNECTFEGQPFLYGTSETFNKCTFNQNSADAYNVWTYGAKEVVFNECTFNSAGKSVLIYAEGASIFNNVKVTKCTFNASAPVEGKAAIEMDSSLTAGINLTIDATTATGFDNGDVSDNSLWNNKKGNQGANNDITVIVDGVVVLAPTIATIGEVTYFKLQTAFNEALDGDIITMTGDVIKVEEVVIDNTDKTVTLDMNGKTWNGAIKPSNAKLTIKNGTINNENASISAIEINTGELNLENVIISSARHAVRIDGAVTATINGGKYTLNATSGTRHAVNVSDAANVTIKAGTFVGPKGTTMDSGSAVCVQSGAKVTIEGGNYSGGKNNTLSADGNLIVKGGTFDQDPSAYVTTPYVVIKKSDNEYNVIKGVAKIGETYYESLAAAITAAQPGNTIELCVDITENVTIGKSLTIDGAQKNYTGGISAKGNANSTTVTVKNVNFVGNSNYAITTNSIKSITVENCTATNYSYGFLYANKSTPTVVVKDVTVNGGNYGFHWVYGTTATLENVTMTNVTNGLLIQNYADKTINVKGCNITSIAIWERENESGVQTFNFTGENTVASLADSQYAKYVLAATDATLTAPEGSTVIVTTELENQGYVVEYNEGVYSVVAGNVLNSTTGKKYATLQAAIDEAINGDEIKVLKDITLGTGESREYTTTSEGTVSVRALNLISGKSVTIDLNGKTLYCEEEAEENQIYNFFAVTEEGHLTIKDSSEDGTGTVEIKNNDAVTTTVHSLIMCYNGTMTIENGNYKLHYGKNGNGMIYSQQNKTVTVNGGNFWLGNVGTLENHSPWIFNASGQNTKNIIVNGGTFNDDILHQYYPFEVMAQKEKALKYDAVEELWTMEDAVAYVDEQHKSGNWYTNEVGFVTLEEAFAAAAKYNHNDTYVTTVTLLANVELSTYVTISKSVNLNLGQFNITRENGTALYFNGEGIEVTINGEGTVSGTQAVYVDNGTVTIDGGNYVGNIEAVYVINNGHAVINGGTFQVEEGDDANFLLNEYDATRDVTTIAVYGGTFHGFNPENNAAEGAGTNFCAPGYGAVETEAGSNIWEVMPVHTHDFYTGWRWYSTYIDINGSEGLIRLENALEDKGLSINHNADGFVNYENGMWYNHLATLKETNVKNMYKIEVSGDLEMKLIGNVVDFNEAIEIKTGYNWIGYPFTKAVNLNEAFAETFEPAEGDYMISQFQFAFYYNGSWNGSLVSLNPGEGYIYERVDVDTELEYNVNNINRNVVKTNISTEDNKWTPNARMYPNNMTMIAVVDGAIGDNYEVAAFVNGEVRGSARPIYIEALDAYMMFLTIHGDEVEEMSFMYYDLTTGESYMLNDRFDYTNDAHLGSVKEPYVFSRGTTGIGDAAMSQVNIYPNPTTTGTEINLEAVCDTVEVFNTLGVKVAEYQNVDSIDALETAGIYVIRITNNGNVQNCRLVVK